MRFLLHPHRAARLLAQNALDESRLSVETLLDELLKATVRIRPTTRSEAAVRHTVNHVVVDELIGLAANGDATGPIRAIARRALESLGMPRSVQRTAIAAEIKRFFAHPEQFARKTPVDLPPDSPIGCACGHDHRQLRP